MFCVVDWYGDWFGWYFGFDLGVVGCFDGVDCWLELLVVGVVVCDFGIVVLFGYC